MSKNRAVSSCWIIASQCVVQTVASLKQTEQVMFSLVSVSGHYCPLETATIKFHFIEYFNIVLV